MAKTHSVQVPVTSDEYKTIRKAASEHGMSAREYAKERLLGTNTPSQSLVQQPSSAVDYSITQGQPTNIYIENATLNLPAGTRIVAPNIDTIIEDRNGKR
ncbi:MAG: hypothetical protein MUF71_15795 [Candidatus Kapabacteria bacterium]|jgi:hypothetical protein|nr:hypothetical protein [Candidatus Kapabacteria bacterium]